MFIKNTKDLFQKLNILDKSLSKSKRKILNEKGYVLISPTKYILKNLKLLNNIANKLIKKEGAKGGWEGKEKYYKKGKYFEYGVNRLGNLVNKHKVFRDLILTPEILAASYEVIKSDIKIGGVDLRSPKKNYGYQAIHIDCFPRKKTIDPFTGVICIIYLNETNLKNGSPRVIPGSHKKLGWPDDHINIFNNLKNQINVNVPPGTILVINQNIWHGGTQSISGKPRKAIYIDIRRRDLPQLLNFKNYLKKEVKKKMNECQKYLLGVRSNDLLHQEDSVGPGYMYRKKFGNKRAMYEKKINGSLVKNFSQD